MRSVTISDTAWTAMVCLGIACLLIVMLVSSGGCATPCRAGTSRCLGTVVQVCGADESWHDAIECSVPDGPWICVEVPADEYGDGGHTCGRIKPEEPK